MLSRFLDRIIEKINSNKRLNLNIRKKLLAGYASVGLLACVSLAAVGYFSAKDIIISVIKGDLSHITDNLHNLCRTSYELNQIRVNHNLDVADYFVKNKTQINKGGKIEAEVENQNTKDKYKITLPAMSVGGETVYRDFKVVDRITSMIGGTVTIFQVIQNPAGLLRVSTSVKRKDGTRAVGTFIPESSPVYKSVIGGETFRGAAFVVDDWYITSYKPILSNNDVIGAIYVGIKQSDLSVLREKFTSVKIMNKGHAYVIDNHQNSLGTLVIHPKNEGVNIIDAKDSSGNQFVKEIAAKKNGSAVYSVKDEGERTARERLYNFRYLQEMEWIIVAECDIDEITASLGSLRNGMIFISVIAVMLIMIVSILISRSISDITGRFVSGMTGMQDGDFSTRMPAADLSRNDELGIMAGAFNGLAERLEVMFTGIKRSVEILYSSIHDLSVTSKEISANSNQQAAAVKEIVATMEESNDVSRRVSDKTSGMSTAADQSKSLVELGTGIINQAKEKMQEIRVSNTETIGGINSLKEKIEGIWEVVDIIKGIADQTKIIAFNAHLEASAAGEAGKNFSIVATEVRRLADNIMESTNDIKDKIKEIQSSSVHLVQSSEEGTSKINDGWELTSRITGIFSEIHSSSESTASEANGIEVSMKQQLAGFEQILLTLKQISEGISEFAAATKSTSTASESLRGISEELNSILEKFRI